MLHKEIERKELEDYIGVTQDSDLEYDSHCSSGEDCFSEDEVRRKKEVKYDIDTMFEIIQKRDFRKWSLSTINNKYRQISSLPSTARSQLTRYYFFNYSMVMVVYVSYSMVLECENM